MLICVLSGCYCCSSQETPASAGKYGSTLYPRVSVNNEVAVVIFSPVIW